MADRNKFEEMLERLINEDREGAEEIFHQLVVEKSREIYESLLEDDEDIEEASKDEEEVEDEVDEASEEDDEEEKTNENFNLDEFEVEADPMAAMGGDPADDMMGDVGMDDEEGDDDMGGEGDVEDRVEDLEDALEDLKAEFEKLMAGDEGEPEMGDDEMDMGDEEGDDEMDMGDEGEPEEESAAPAAAPFAAKITPLSAGEQMREYVEKVTAKMGDNGQNTKSIVAGKNDMGGTASNLVKGGESTSGGTKGGLAAPSSKEDSAGNVNVPGGKASKSLKTMPKGHGAEKKGAGENATNKKSLIGGK